MATKDFNFKPRTFVNSNFKNSQYNNLNLNGNITSSPDAVVLSKNEIFLNKSYEPSHFDSVNGTTEGRKISSHESILSKKTNILNKSVPVKANDKNGRDSTLKSSSTLSLHIAAYENSATFIKENQNASQKKVSNNILKDPYTINVFEFPRQQEQEPMDPEVMQFKASQTLLGQEASTRKGRPKGALAKKTIKSETGRNSISQRYIPAVLETMNSQQQLHFNCAIERAEKAEKDAAEKQILITELQSQIALSQQQHKKDMEAEQAKTKVAEQKYEEERDKRQLAEENCRNESEKRKIAEENYQQVLTEIFTTKQKLEATEKESAKKISKLENNITVLQDKNKQQKKERKSEEEKLINVIKEREAEAINLLKCNEKLQATLNETAANHRYAKVKLDEVQKIATELQSEKDKLLEIISKLEEASKKDKSKLPIRRKVHKLKKPRLLPYDATSSRTKQRRVKKAVQDLEAVPNLKEKVLNRFKPKAKKTTRKITPLQAVTMAITVGFNPNQMENLKSFLRFFDADILPPIHEIRKALKTLKNEFQYEDFEDKNLGVVGRRIVDVENVAAVRCARLMESGRWVDVPGFEDFAFFGLTADSGGGYLQCAFSIMNVDDGWGSPNNGTIIASGKIPTENYETVKCVCGESFHQVNQLDGKQITFNVNGTTVTKTAIVIACFDGKMGCLCSGHSGSSSAHPCYGCNCTKQQLNKGIMGQLRNYKMMVEQAKRFEEKKAAAKTPAQLSKLRYEVECITKPPLLTIDYSQWIYGILHAVMGPTTKALDVVEDIALQEDLKELQIVIPSSKDLRKASKEQNKEIENVKTYIAELNKAMKSAKTIMPHWKKARKSGAKEEPICGAKYCLQTVMGADPLFNTFLKCRCGTFVHSTCDLLLINYEIEYAQNSEYLCPICDPISDDAALSDLVTRQKEWEREANELKIILKEKEKAAKESKTEIPYDQCQRYQRIQLKLKELKVYKNLYFQKLNGVDVRKLIKNRESFVQVVREDLREDVKILFDCLNTYQELAEKQFLTNEDIQRLNPEELRRAYKAICGEEVPPKVHQLTDHTPKFMMKFHFYQLVNDHAIEHVHRIVNILLQKLCISKDEPQKALKAITDNFSIRNKLFDFGINIDSLRNLSLEEKQNLINNLDIL